MKEDAHGAVEIPDKFYFKIGEVSDIAGVPAYVLRFWETAFKQIKPQRTESGQRLYRRQDVVLLLRIKQLLYDKRFTIEGAQQYLKQKSNPQGASAMEKEASRSDLSEIRAELIRIRDLIDDHRR